MTIILVEQRIQSALDFADHAIDPRARPDRLAGTPAELAGQPEVVERLLGVGGLH